MHFPRYHTYALGADLRRQAMGVCRLIVLAWWALAWSAGVWGTVIAPAWPLNDTGIAFWDDGYGGWADGFTTGLPAPPAGYPGQDASFGRDHQANNDADGYAGFSFTKLDGNGRALPAGATAWSCVRDNVTGLIWEIRPDDGGLRDRDWTYTWYEPDGTRNGGSAGTQNGGSCGGGIRCDTWSYARAVNGRGLCGARDWRVPTVDELGSIVALGGSVWAIDSDFFPDMASWVDPDTDSWDGYWSISPDAEFPDIAWNVFFGYGSGSPSKYIASRVRLVRGGQALYSAAPPATAVIGPVGGPSNPSGAAAEPVNTATGNYYYQHSDLSLPGRGLGLSFTRTYNTQDATIGPFGRGWTHAYQTRLTENADGSVVVRHGDGHSSFFDHYADGTYGSRYAGVHDHLVKASATQFILTARDQTRRTFVNGAMTRLSDPNGNALVFAYNAAGRLSTITDTVGRVLTLTYDTNGRLLQLGAPLGRTLSYAYDANGDLISDTDPAGGIQRYTYDGSRRLTRITNRRGQVLVDNTYDGTHRVVSQVNGRGSTTTFAYDTPNAGETTITNALGEATIHRHDDQHRLVAEIDPLNHAVQYGYDADNNRIQVTDRNGQVTRYTYDARGNVLTQTDALGGVTTLTYDANDRPLTRTDALGGVTTWTYDTAGNLLTETDALGQVTRYTYDTRGQRLTRTDANGHQTRYAYDSTGNRTAITNPLGQITRTAYDAAGRPTQVTDANGHVTRFGYDANDRLRTSTDALNQRVQFAYDADGNRTRVTDANGKVTSTAYDANDNVVRVTDPTAAVTRWTYDAADQGTAQTDPLGHITRYRYDAAHRLIGTTDALGQVTSYGYDANGNRLTQTDPLRRTLTYRYDALNRLTRTTDPLGHATAWQYDALARRTAETDALGRTTTSVYDALGRLVQVRDPAGNSSRVAYDAVGNRLSVTNPNAQETTYTYDAADRRLTETDPLGAVTTWQYDAAGNPTRRTDAKGQVTQYGYDAVNRLTSTRYADGSTVTLSYDANGNVTGMTDALGTTSLGYDARNRLTAQTDPFGAVVTHGYDAVGNRTLLGYPDGRSVSYGYDAQNRLASVTDWLGNRTNYSYDAAGGLTGTQYGGNGTQARFGYDAGGRLTSVVHQRDDLRVVARYDLTLDAVGNRTAVSRQDPVAPRYVARTTPAVYDDADRLTNLGGTAVSLDANGNLLSQPGGRYGYDGADRLTSANGQVYAYDGRGRRLAATRAGVATRYVLDLAAPLTQVLMERDTAGTARAAYVFGLGLIARMTPSGDVRHYHFDANGNTVALTGPSGAVTDAYAYSPFGEVLSQQGSTANPFRFLGQFGVQHEGNGINYIRARYYHPATGRFLSRDPLKGTPGAGQTLNAYAYALNNPVRLVDVSGLSAREGGQGGGISSRSSDSAHEPLLQFDIMGGATDLMRHATDWKIVKVVKAGETSWRRAPRVGLAGKIANSGVLEAANGFLDVYSVLNDGYAEITDRGYTLAQVADVWKWKNARRLVTEASEDEWLNALTEGVTSATALTMRTAVKTASFGFVDMPVTGKGLQERISQEYRVDQIVDAWKSAPENIGWLMGSYFGGD